MTRIVRRMTILAIVLAVALAAFSFAAKDVSIRVNYEGIVDNSTLAVSLIAPADSAEFTGTDDALDFNFSVAHGDTLVDCNLLIDNKVSQLIRDIYDQQGLAGYDSQIGDGPHTWKVLCWDNESNSDSSEQRTFELILPPEVSILDKADWHNTTEIQIRYEVFDAHGIDRCTLYIDGDEDQAETGLENGNHSFYSTMSQGPHDAHIACADLRGEESETDEYSFTVDDSPPIVQAITPDDAVFSGSTAQLDFNVSDNIAEDLDCSLFVDDGWRSSAVFESDTQHTFAENLSQGIYGWYVECKDHAGNAGVSDERQFVLEGGPYVNLSVSKKHYDLGETVPVTIDAPDGSSLELTISWHNGNSQLSPSGLGNDFPIVYSFLDTEKASDYTIHARIHLNETKAIDLYESFTVDNSIEVDIDVDDSRVDVNKVVEFEGHVTGGVAPYTFKWDFGDGSTATSQNTTHAYGSEDNYLTTLEVTDVAGNKRDATKKIIVRTKHDVTVKVTDYTTSQPIQNARVLIGDNYLSTDSGGNVVFELEKGDYVIVVTKTGYADYAMPIDIESAVTLDVLLKKHDTAAPDIALLSPANEMVGSPATFKFRVVDDSSTECSVFTSDDDQWWTLQESVSLQGTQEASVALELAEGSYYWKVECKDAMYNSRMSDTAQFTVDSSVQPIEYSESDDVQEPAIVSQIDGILELFAGYDADRREIVESLALEHSLKKAKDKFNRLNRDIFNLKFRQLNTTEFLDTREQILQESEDTKNELPVSVNILDKVQFVNYPTKEEAEELAQLYMELSGMRLSKSQERSFVEANAELQSKVSITTKAMHVEITRYDGTTSQFTFVVHTIDSEQDLQRSDYVVMLPKSIVESADDVNYLTDYEILEMDPIFSVPSTEKVAYMVDELVDLAELPKVVSVVLWQDALSSGSNSAITGMSILDDLGITGTSKTVVIIELCVVGLLVVVYLAYMFKPRLRRSKRAKFAKKLSYLQGLANDVTEELASNDLRKAAILYAEISLIYETLPAAQQNEVYDRMADIGNLINYYHCMDLISRASKSIGSGDKAKAVMIYHEIEQVFSLLSATYREKLFPDSQKLYARVHNALQR